MKKFAFLLFLPLAIVSVSCEGNVNETPYDPNGAQSTALLKKKILLYDNGAKDTIEYHYNGYELTNYTTSSGQAAVFVYADGNLIRIDYFDGSTLTRSDNFTYNAEGLVLSHVRTEPVADLGSRETFAYNGDGSVSFTAYYGTAAVQNTPDLPGKLFFADNELVKIERYLSGELSSSESFEYDTGNNPLRNASGYNLALAFSGMPAGLNHNITTSSDTENPRQTVYQYDTSNFPVTSQTTSALDPGVNAQYFY